MDFSDFFRLAMQSGAKFNPDTQKMEFGPAEVMNFNNFLEDERQENRTRTIWNDHEDGFGFHD